MQQMQNYKKIQGTSEQEHKMNNDDTKQISTNNEYDGSKKSKGRKAKNYINELREFCRKYRVNVFSPSLNDDDFNDDVVIKKKTMIHFYCFMCRREVKKSYQCLCGDKNEFSSPWSNLCTKCFRQAHY